MRFTKFWIEFSQWEASGIISGETNLTDHFEKGLNHGVISGALSPKSITLKIYFVEPEYKPTKGNVIYSVNEKNILTYFVDNYDTSD